MKTKTAEDYRNERKAILTKLSKLASAGLPFMQYISKANRLEDRLRRVDAEIKRRK